MNPLADLILTAHARTRPAFTDRRTRLVNEELFAAADQARLEILAAAVHTSRPTVAAVLPLTTDALVMLVAAIVGDLTLCFLDPSAPHERNRAVLDAVRPDVVVDLSGVRANGPGPARESVGGYVAMSSGSTGGGPKGVLSPWGSIAEFVPHGAAALGLDEDCAWAELNHPAYDLAMTNLLVALATGCSIHVSSSLGDRLRPLAFTERVAATHVRLAPRFIDLAVAEKRENAPASLRVWGSGGDRLSVADARRVLDLGIATVVNTYGTSETIGFASAASLTAANEIHEVHGAAPIGTGAVGPWRTDLVEDSMLAISSPHLPAGYLFGKPSGDFPRWQSGNVLTGDIGATADGMIFCLGRAGRRVKRSASFIDLDDLDAQVKATFGTTVFTASTAAGDLVSLVEGPETKVISLLAGLPTVLRPDSVPNRLIAVPQIPRLGNGKIDLAAAQRLAER